MIKVSKIFKVQGNSSLKAYAYVLLGDNKVLIKNVKIIESKKGELFVALPNQQGKDGKYYEILSFLDPEIKKKLQEEVLKAYQA